MKNSWLCNESAVRILQWRH